MKLMTHIVAGYPTMEESEKIAMAMYESGVSFIEVQIPFSDPIADGPTIMKANEISLQNGTTPRDCMEFIKRIKKKIKIPIFIMTYFNIPFNYGLEKFCEDASDAGVYGLIIPDMPIDEEKYEHYISLCKKHNLHAIQVISQMSRLERLKALSKVASGFVYCISSLGTTGTRSELNPKLEKYLKNVKRYIKIPLAVGFGISTKEQVKLVGKKAEIVVIGSKIINLYNETATDKITAIKSFLKDLM
ncbi:MAG: tryptophan synthase subunit alpha [Candidatus Peregrinibacteria bacterium]|nr:tryptophan synthase subunit alpha [Candidatus Peregrinibacteria bacterium]